MSIRFETSKLLPKSNISTQIFNIEQKINMIFYNI